MRAELVLNRCLFYLEAFFHFKAEEAVLHSPRPQEFRVLFFWLAVVLLMIFRRIVVGSGLFNSLNG
jgi:hypothetical protein